MLFGTYVKTIVRVNKYFVRTQVKGLTNLEKYLRSPVIGVLSVTFGQYTKNKERTGDNRRREVIGIGLCIFGWLTVIKFYSAALIKDSHIWPMIGDPFYLTKDRILFNLAIGSIALNATLMRTLFLIGLRNRKLVFIEDFYRLQRSRASHRLFRDNFLKIQFRCTLSEYFMLKQIPINALLLFSLIYGYYTVCAYLRQDYNYNLFVSLIWWLVTTLAAWVAASMQGVSYSILYLSQYYLKIRFRQTTNRMINPLSQSSEVLRQSLREHNKIAKRTDEYNKFFNEVVAINYFAATISIDLLFYIAFFGRGDVLFRVGNGMIAINKIAVICLATYSSAQFSDEVHRLYAPLNSLLINKRMLLLIKVKVIQLIERLAGPTIGFYCYDIFAFNITHFFNYMSGCVVLFFLLVTIINMTPISQIE